MYRVPVSYFAGNSNILFVIRGMMENIATRHFMEKRPYIKNLREKGPKMDSLIGKTYYFNPNDVYYKNEKKSVDREVTFIEDLQKPYDIKEGFYKCVGFGYFPRPAYLLPFYDYYPIFEDNVGQTDVNRSYNLF